MHDLVRAMKRESTLSGRRMALGVGVCFLVGAAMLAAALKVGHSGAFRRRDRLWRSEAMPAAAPTSLDGLTEAEAAARAPAIDLDALDAAARRRFIRRAVRSNLLTVFNLNFFAIAALMLLMGSPISGLGTLGVLIANVVIHVGQETLARRRLESLIAEIRPRVTVVREGTPRQLAVREIVRGDLIAVGLGDEIPVSAVVLGGSDVEVAGLADVAAGESLLKPDGSEIEAGSYCVGGHAILRAQEAGAEREALQGTRAQILSHALTPLEILVRRVLFALLTVVLVFSVVLLTGDYIERGTSTSETAYRNAFSLVLGTAPTSLFFLLVLSYVMGLLDIARRGALVYRPNTIEALAGVTTVCLDSGSVMSGAQVTVVPIESSVADAPPPDRGRRLLSDLMQSTPPNTVANELIAAALPGNRRHAVQVAGHLSMYGWQAASFDEPDMRGTFVVGVADMIKPEIAVETATLAEAAAVAAEKPKLIAERGFIQARHFLARHHVRGGAHADSDSDSRPEPPASAARRLESAKTRAVRPTIRSWISTRARRGLASRDLRPPADIVGPPAPPRTLVFAYRPDVVPLLGTAGQPLLPRGLIPLAQILVNETVSPEARGSIRSLQGAGISVALLIGADSASVAKLARSLGVDRTLDLSGLTPVRRAEAIRALARGGGMVAQVAHGLSKRTSTPAADVAIVLRGAPQAVLSQADVVLVEDSLGRLPGILSAARRIANGVIAMLSLNLSHIATQLGLLTLVFVLVLRKFPYTPVQSGAITAFSISVPSVALLLLAPSRLPGTRGAALRLTRFVVPSGLATMALVLGVFLGSLATGRTVAAAQLATTWTLVAAGLVRVLFVLPPTRLWTGAEPLVGDRRVFGLIGIAAGLFMASVAIPLTRGWLGMGWLDSASEYAVLAGALIVWGICLLTFWRWVWRDRVAVPPTSITRIAAETSMAELPS